MRHCARYCIGGTLSINAVAAQVGYESEAAFNRAFKRLVGLAPGAWRKARTLPQGAPLQAAESRQALM